LREGTSAHRQRRAFDAAMAAGKTKRQALEAVVDELIAGTVAGL
jgi:hypothetical protein